MIKINSISKNFGGVKAVNDATFTDEVALVRVPFSVVGTVVVVLTVISL